MPKVEQLFVVILEKEDGGEEIGSELYADEQAAVKCLGGISKHLPPGIEYAQLGVFRRESDDALDYADYSVGIEEQDEDSDEGGADDGSF